jgi:uncharacterized protein (TIGR04255 family)
VPELLGVAGGDALSELVTQALEQIQLEHDQGKMTIRHGFLKEETTEDSPGGSVYALDFDAFDESHRPLEVDSLVGSLDLYKSWVWNLFRSSITDDMIDFLQPEDLDD